MAVVVSGAVGVVVSSAAILEDSAVRRLRAGRGGRRKLPTAPRGNGCERARGNGCSCLVGTGANYRGIRSIRIPQHADY
jgi:hypothetical protein